MMRRKKASKLTSWAFLPTIPHAVKIRSSVSRLVWQVRSWTRCARFAFPRAGNENGFVRSIPQKTRCSGLTYRRKR